MFVSSKVQSSDKSRSVNPVRHHCQPLASSLSTKSAHEVCRPFRCNPDITTDDLRGCQPSLKSPVTHSPAALSRVSKTVEVFWTAKYWSHFNKVAFSFQDMQHKHPTTTENKNDGKCCFVNLLNLWAIRVKQSVGWQQRSNSVTSAELLMTLALLHLHRKVSNISSLTSVACQRCEGYFRLVRVWLVAFILYLIFWMEFLCQIQVHCS